MIGKLCKKSPILTCGPANCVIDASSTYSHFRGLHRPSSGLRQRTLIVFTAFCVIVNVPAIHIKILWRLDHQHTYDTAAPSMTLSFCFLLARYAMYQGPLKSSSIRSKLSPAVTPNSSVGTTYCGWAMARKTQLVMMPTHPRSTRFRPASTNLSRKA